MSGNEPNQPQHDELDLEVSKAPLQTRRNVVGKRWVAILSQQFSSYRLYRNF